LILSSLSFEVLVLTFLFLARRSVITLILYYISMLLQTRYFKD
jgi:hypothetical protein